MFSHLAKRLFRLGEILRDGARNTIPFFLTGGLMALTIIELKVTNWNKYNSGHDASKRSGWFKLSNAICDDDKIMQLSHETFRVFMKILCERSRKSSENLQICPAFTRKSIGISEKKFMQAIETLNDLGLLECPIKKRIEENRREERRENKHDTDAFPSGVDIVMRLVKIWNEVGGGCFLPVEEKYLIHNTKRLKELVLLKEKNPVTEEEFKSLVERASKSSFLKGNNDRNWKATFDWFLAIENMNKIIEGNFNFEKINKPKKTKAKELTRAEMYEMFGNGAHEADL